MFFQNEWFIIFAKKSHICYVFLKVKMYALVSEQQEQVWGRDQEQQNSCLHPGSTCTQGMGISTVLCAQILPGEYWSAGSELTPSFGGQANSSFTPVTEQAGTARQQGPGAAEQLGESQSSLHLHVRSGLHHSTLRQGRACHPGVLRQACRPTKGTSTHQRQQNQLTPEITRWQKANVGT